MSGYTTYWKRTSLQCSTRAEMRKENRFGGEEEEEECCQIHHMGCLLGVKGSLTIALKSTCRLGSKQQKQLSIAQYCFLL